jgi:ParB/RepB/Spo0J family partition protein
MNAPTAPAAIAAAAKLEFLPLARLKPSSTHIQELRRARFDKKALQELADSIRKVGILQPIVARPLGEAFEIVAGERRFLAARLAGLDAIAVNVSRLTDDQVLEIQLIENLQREGLHEIEEAEGYEELMKLKKINADTVADMVGKSRSYVYARTKLLALCPEARKAFYAGDLDASKALLIARIGHHDTQRAAMKALAGNKWDGPLSFRQAHQVILRDYMLKLRAAPFARDDATLLPKAGTCTACPKRTGNQKDLFADVNDADVCTDPKCFAEKRDAHWARQRAALEKSGKKVIAGAAAKRIFPYSHTSSAQGGMTSLDAKCWDDPRGRKVGEIIGKDSPAIQYVQHPENGDLVPVVPSTAITEALNAKGIKTHRQKVAAQTNRRGNSGPKRDDERDGEITAATFERALKIVHANAKSELGLPQLRLLADEVWRRATEDAISEVGVALCNSFGWKRGSGYDQPLPKEVARYGAKELQRFITICLVASGLEGLYDSNDKELAKSMKVDVKAIEEKVRAEFKKKDDEAKAAKKPRAVDKVNAAIEKRVAKAKAKRKSKPITKGKKK